jgi:O-antigen/teichoic acid export membrane protein
MSKARVGLFRNAMTLASAQVLNLGLVFIGRIVLARLLGVAAFGAFGAALNAVTVLSRVLSFGSASASQFYAGKGDFDRKQILGTSLAISSIVSLFAGAILSATHGMVASTFFSEHPSGLIAYQALVWFVPLVILTMNLGVLLIPFGLVGKYGQTQVLQGGMFLVPCVILALFVPGLQASVIGQALVWVATFAFVSWHLWRTARGLSFCAELAHQMVKYGFKAWPNVCLNIGIARIATLIAAIYLGSVELGIFVLAMNLVEAACSPQIAAGQLILNRAASGSESGATLRMMRLSVGYFACVAIVLVGFAWTLLPLVFGREFAPVRDVIGIVAITGAAHAMMKTIANFAAGQGKPQLATLGLLFESTALAVLLPTLAPQFGIIGVAWAGAVSALLGWLTAGIQMRKLSGSGLKSQLVPTSADIIELSQHVNQLVKKSA